MRKIVKKTTLWRCLICGTDHKKKSDAKRCEKRPVEEQAFKVGDRVTNALEPRMCSLSDDKGHRFKGRIIRVLGPMSPDAEYWNKWLGGRPKTHVFQYKVTYKCPKCGKIKSALYFAPELKHI